MEYTTLTFPHTVGRHDVLTHVSRSALSQFRWRRAVGVRHAASAATSSAALTTVA
jgi:hypothetical protein